MLFYGPMRMQREKNEEIGETAIIKVLPHETYNVLFRKKDGNHMILPHIPAVFVRGSISLSDEYSGYKWVPLADLSSFEPKVPNIPQLAQWAAQKVANPNAAFVSI